MSNIKEFRAHPIKYLRDSAKNIFVFCSIIFLLYLIPLAWLKDNTLFLLIGIGLYFLLILAMINYLIVIFNEMWTKARYTLLMIILIMVVVIVPPFYIGGWKQLDSLNTFLTIVIGIGINYAIDAVFEFVKADNVPYQEKSLQQKSAITKILFNCLYISECIAFVLIKNSNDIRFIKNQVESSNHQVVFIFLILIIWVLFVSISLLFITAVRVELKNERKQDLESLTIELCDNKDHILNVRKQLMDTDEKKIVTFNEIVLKYEIQLKELEKIITADDSEK